MSYQNGINTLQQLFTQLNPTSTTSTAQTAQVSGNAAGSSVAKSAPATSAVGDQTSLSTLGGMAAQASQGDDVRTEKVASIQTAISNGTYNVSSSDVADSIINSLMK